MLARKMTSVAWRTGCAAFVCAVFLSACRDAAAALIFYSDRPTFDAANPGLPIEGFEEANTGINFDAPLDSTSSNAVFSPGDILSGVSFTTIPEDNFDLRVDSFSGTTKILNTPAAHKVLQIDFAPGVAAVGLDVYQIAVGPTLDPGNLTIQVFGTSGLLTTQLVAGGSFFGIESTTEAITQITVDDSAILPAIDNVAFGGTVQQVVPEPSTFVLVGFGALALVGARGRRLRRRFALCRPD